MRGPAGLLRRRAGATLHASQTAAAPWVRRIALCFVASLFLAFSGAFGSADMPIPRRLAFWFLTVGLGGAIGGLVADLSARLSWPRGMLASAAFVTFATTLPLTILIWILFALFFLDGALDPHFLPKIVLPALVLTAAMVALNLLADRQPIMTHAAAPDAAPGTSPASASAPRLLDRLPARLRGAELHAVEAEDHYLRLHTSRGSDLILLRLADAIAELDGIEGAQTHRSWWVARGAVDSARRTEGRAVLLLKNGVEAPVSRTYIKALREAGWF